ncbi:MAG: hypothetical protein BGP25_00050 [Lysobacterales bacterium 63-13]|nr:MAG: hypothetical protein BGP25_00050 [Xanthomonadales bacterium 63-13]
MELAMLVSKGSRRTAFGQKRTSMFGTDQPALEPGKHLAQLRPLDEQRYGNDSWMSEFVRKEESRFDDTQSRDHKYFLEHGYESKKQLILRLLGL